MELNLEKHKGLVGFENAVKAERNDANVLILKRLKTPFRRVDGKKAGFEMEYRWLTGEDADVTEVRGRDFTYWQEHEIRDWQNASLFDLFGLYC